MQIRTLEAFVEIIRQNGFSAAAKKLNATQSTMSKVLSQLENHYAIRLVDRKRGQLKLTSAGELIYRHALRIIAEEQAAQQEIAEIKGLARGNLRVGLPPIGSSTLFAPVFAAYTAAHPDIDITIVEHGSKKLEEMVKANELDLAASLFPVAAGLEYQNVINEPIVALKASGTGPKIASLKQLASQPFVLFESQFALTPIVMNAFKNRGLEPKIVARSSQIDFILGLVAAGMGVSFLPRMILEKRRFPGVDILEIEGQPLQWHMVLVWSQHSNLSFAAREWLKMSKAFHS